MGEAKRRRASGEKVQMKAMAFITVAAKGETPSPKHMIWSHGFDFMIKLCDIPPEAEAVCAMAADTFMDYASKNKMVGEYPAEAVAEKVRLWLNKENRIKADMPGGDEWVEMGDGKYLKLGFVCGVEKKARKENPGVHEQEFGDNHMDTLAEFKENLPQMLEQLKAILAGIKGKELNSLMLEFQAIKMRILMCGQEYINDLNAQDIFRMNACEKVCDAIRAKAGLNQKGREWAAGKGFRENEFATAERKEFMRRVNEGKC